MDEKTTGARGTVLGCLAAAGAFLVLDLLLRSISLGQRGLYLELFVFPAVLGFGVGWLMGPRWRRPMLASLLVGAALVLADTIPYTLDTMYMANLSDEFYASAAREHPGSEVASLPPSEFRRRVVLGRVISFLMLGPIVIGGLTALGALLGRSLQTRSSGAGRRASA